jgi:hypothetical protein
MHFPLGVRIILSETRDVSRRSAVYGGTEMTRMQIDELNDALLDLPVPWFTVRKRTELTGFMHYVFDHLVRTPNRNASDSALLLLLAAAFDLAGEPLPDSRGLARKTKPMMSDVGLRAILRTIEMRYLLLGGGTDLDAETLPPGQEPLFEIERTELDIRQMLLSAGIEEKTALLIRKWTTDPSFQIIAYKLRKRRVTSAAKSGVRHK